MLRRIVGLALVCLVVIVSLQLWWERNDQKKQFFEFMGVIVASSSNSLAGAVWDIEWAQLQKHVQRLADLDAVAFVQVQVLTTGEVFSAGQRRQGHASLIYRADIHAPAGSEANLGSIEIWADAAYYRALLWESQLHVLPGYLLFTLLVCLMVAGVMRRDLGAPLQQIAEFARTLKPEQLSQPLKVQRPSRARADEIDMVMQGFRQLQTALDRHIQDLDGLVRERTSELNALVDEVERLSQLDALTGVYNRRAMEQRLPRELQRSALAGRPYAVIFTDIDYFKRINDQHGHGTGDAVLRSVSAYFQASLRENRDWMVRFGGEEFVMFLPDTTLAHALEAAERLAQQVRAHSWCCDGVRLKLSCSFGVAQWQPGEAMETLLERADRMLYQAKHTGRDRVCWQA